MSFNKFLNNSARIEDAIICGKILLHKTEWEISYICDVCQRNLSTLTELLRHALSEHIDDVPQGKVRELCDIETTEEIDVEFEDQKLDATISSAWHCESEDDEKESIRSASEYKAETDECYEFSYDMEHIENDNMVCQQEDDIEVKNECDDYAELTISCGLDEERIGDCNKSLRGHFEFWDVDGKNARTKSILICSVCNVKFPTRRQLATHRKTHGNRPYVCKQCGTAFADKRNLTVHVNRHNGIKPHRCTYCKMTFTTKTELNIHIRSHTGERPYKCTECDKWFTSASDRTKHQIRHSNVRSCLCPICGKTFFDAKIMKNHMKTHSTERPHKCRQCDAKFSTTSGLRQHEELHSGVKKHNCQFCEKTFAQRSGLYAHLKAMHKNENK